MALTSRMRRSPLCQLFPALLQSLPLSPAAQRPRNSPDLTHMLGPRNPRILVPGFRPSVHLLQHLLREGVCVGGYNIKNYIPLAVLVPTWASHHTTYPPFVQIHSSSHNLPPTWQPASNLDLLKKQQAVTTLAETPAERPCWL